MNLIAKSTSVELADLCPLALATAFETAEITSISSIARSPVCRTRVGRLQLLRENRVLNSEQHICSQRHTANEEGT
jgi:hypothetical protein